MKKWLLIGTWLFAVLAVVARPIDAQTPEGKPFGLPFAEPSGPNTWYLGQGYGNTIGSYFQRDTTYRAGQGLHFGIDLAAPCGTPVVAIGDGVVAKVDAFEHGSRPHNLMLQLDAGYAALYGHFVERPKLNVGDRVTQGQVVGLSGDSFGTCHSAPHLHLEIRSPDYLTAYNPITLIEADWDSLALVGAFQRGFERDLDDPRRWQYPDDQPETKFGGPLLNNYRAPWPPDWYRRR
ncbi:peptidoglycan LD-endopeptidase LytH [Thermoflexales bacterium]|nr:peptidoglycan LD-endopeptidase LytH [Thermoflexales bacterium]